MFMIEIAGVRVSGIGSFLRDFFPEFASNVDYKVLYTGDYSCEEDRHLMKAEIPQVKPHVLISVSTLKTDL